VSCAVCSIAAVKAIADEGIELSKKAPCQSKIHHQRLREVFEGRAFEGDR